MGREIKRVTLDFDWPLNETWQGFVNPYHFSQKCPDCDGSGYSPEAKRLNAQWYGYEDFDPSMTGSQPLTPETPEVRAFAERNVGYSPNLLGTGEYAVLREAGRLLRNWNAQWCHHLDQDDVDALVANGRLWDFTKHGTPHPTAAEVNLWSISGWGHDGINQYICVKAKCERLGVASECSACDGDGTVYPSKAAKYIEESWVKIEPPAGDGWQLWETVSEGSPISPVFPTREAFIAYLVEQGSSQQAAEKFTEVGFVPSMMMDASGIKSNIDILDAELD